MTINEVVGFIIRETGWTLEYIYSLPLKTLSALVEELAYQKAVDNYQQAHNAALIVSVLCSSREHYVSCEDIIGKPPEREKKMDELIKPIDKITLADGKEYTLKPVDLNMLVDVEAKFNEPFNKILTQAKTIRYLVSLRLKDYELTEEKVGELITLDVLTKVSELLGM